VLCLRGDWRLFNSSQREQAAGLVLRTLMMIHCLLVIGLKALSKSALNGHPEGWTPICFFLELCRLKREIQVSLCPGFMNEDIVNTLLVVVRIKGVGLPFKAFAIKISLQ
jgi:hypothetical protein